MGLVPDLVEIESIASPDPYSFAPRQGSAIHRTRRGPPVHVARPAPPLASSGKFLSFVEHSAVLNARWGQIAFEFAFDCFVEFDGVVVGDLYGAEVAYIFEDVEENLADLALEVFPAVAEVVQDVLFVVGVAQLEDAEAAFGAEETLEHLHCVHQNWPHES
jgi:hypothetical protein